MSLHVVASTKEKGDELKRLIERGCLYTGFVAVSDFVVEEIPSMSGVVVRATFGRPGWELGATASAAVAVGSSGDNAASLEFVDEEALLDGEDPSVKNYTAMGEGKESCASKPKACSNCTCGRRELEEEVGAEEAKRRLENGTVRSSCGSCYLGDAFRCATCPYLGMPAFKPGEKLQLDVDKSNLGSAAVIASNDTPATGSNGETRGKGMPPVGSVVKVAL